MKIQNMMLFIFCLCVISCKSFIFFDGFLPSWFTPKCTPIPGHNFCFKDLMKLKQQTQIDILTPNSNGYDDAKNLFGSVNEKTPDFVAVIPNVNNYERKLTKLLEFLIDFDEKFVIKSGGHNVGGYSTCDGSCFVISLSNLTDIGMFILCVMCQKRFDCGTYFGLTHLYIRPNIYVVNIDIDTEKERVKIDPGVRSNRLVLALDNLGYWLPIGADDIGMGGHIHGGGWGVGLRKYGLATDGVIRAKVITYTIKPNGKAKARVSIASKNINNDLFFCIRGVGGPSCGIVIQCTIRIYKQPETMIFASYSAIPTSFNSFAKMHSIPHEYGANTDIIDMFCIQSSDTIIFNAQKAALMTTNFIWYGNDTNRGHFELTNGTFGINIFDNDPEIIPIFKGVKECTWARCRCLVQFGIPGDSLCDQINNDFSLVIPEYDGVILGFLVDEPTVWPTFVNEPINSTLFSGFTPLLYVFNEILTKCPGNPFPPSQQSTDLILCGVYAEAWGGDLKNIDPLSTGFGYRNTTSNWGILTISTPFTPEPQRSVINSIADNIWNFLYSISAIPAKHYVNYINVNLPNDVYRDAYYGLSKDKLIQTKCKYDTLNVFDNAQGVLLSKDECI